MLKFASTLLGEDHSLLLRVDHKSRQRVITLASLLFIPVCSAAFATWFFGSIMGHGLIPSLAVAAVVGGIILLLDRSLVQSGASKSWGMWIVRILLSIAMSFVASIAIDASFFAEDIAPIVERLRAEQVDQEVDVKLRADRRAIAQMESEVAILQSEANAAQLSFEQEMDGTGGSGSAGFGDISKQKKALASLIAHRRNDAESNLENAPKVILEREHDIRHNRSNAGLLLYIKALHEHASSDTQTAITCSVFALICFLAEIMFLLIKIFSKPTAYDTAILELEEQTKARIRLETFRREAREERQKKLSPFGHLVDQEISALN